VAQPQTNNTIYLHRLTMIPLKGRNDLLTFIDLTTTSTYREHLEVWIELRSTVWYSSKGKIVKEYHLVLFERMIVKEYHLVLRCMNLSKGNPYTIIASRCEQPLDYVTQSSG
jgi:hypothetical protein